MAELPPMARTWNGFLWPTFSFTANAQQRVLRDKGYGLEVSCPCSSLAGSSDSFQVRWQALVIARGVSERYTGSPGSGCATAEEVLALLKSSNFPDIFDILIAPGLMNGFHIVRSV